MSYTESTNVISLTNALPTSDTNGKVLDEYFDFSVSTNTDLNEGYPNIEISYEITLEPLSVSSGYTALTDSQIKVYLENKDTSSILTGPTLISSLSTSESNTNTKVLYTNTHTHTSEVDSITTNYEYKFRININGVADYEVPALSLYTTLFTSDVPVDNTSSTYVSSSTGINFGTAPGTSNGQGLYIRSGTENDENPIYYYRGAVTNNNIVFGKYCWKIVRTTSTGGVKLIYNGEYTESNKCNNTGTASQLSSKSVFNTNYDAAYYVGYYYDTSDTMTTMNNGTALNTTPSTIATAVNTWYASEESGMTDLTYMLENEKWCNDRTNDGSKYFGAYTRLVSSSSSVNPSIECPNNNDAFTLKEDKGGVKGYGNNVLDYPVGLLTADEATLAGSGYHGYSSSAYLNSSQYYWLVSPGDWYGSNANGLNVVSSGNLFDNGVNYSNGVRPSVSLIPGAEIEEGNTGTKDDPYVVVLE